MMSPKAVGNGMGTRQVFGFDAPFGAIDPTASLRTIYSNAKTTGAGVIATSVAQQQTTPISLETPPVNIPETDPIYQSKSKRKSSPPIDTPNGSKRH